MFFPFPADAGVFVTAVTVHKCDAVFFLPVHRVVQVAVFVPDVVPVRVCGALNVTPESDGLTTEDARPVGQQCYESLWPLYI